MTKRYSKETTFFCLPEELPTLLQPILAKGGAQLCVVKEKGGRYHFRRALLPEDLEAADQQFYTCVPTMAAAYGLESLANLVQVWFPVLKDNRLRMGRIAMLVTESELEPEVCKLQEEIYRDVRKALMKNFGRGVLGRNSKTGGEHFYNDILISERAARAYAGGTVLATLMGDGFVTYHVRSSDAG